MASDQVPPDDPLDLEAVDREIQFNELMESTPPGLRDVVAYEFGPQTTDFDELTKAGIDLPSPDAMDDAALHAKLWEVINALADRDITLSHTDHLSDRQLYEHLWHDSLREEGPAMMPGSGWMGEIDILGSWGEEEVQIGLRYYDSEEERQEWAKQWPDDVIPPHEDLPYDRDRHLPGPRGPSMREEMSFGSGEVADDRSDDDPNRDPLDDIPY